MSGVECRIRSMLRRRLMPVDQNGDASERRSVCHPSLGLVIPARLIAGTTCQRQTVPGHSGCLPNDTCDASAQSAGATQDDHLRMWFGKSIAKYCCDLFDPLWGYIRGKAWPSIRRQTTRIATARTTGDFPSRLVLGRTASPDHVSRGLLPRAGLWDRGGASRHAADRACKGTDPRIPS